MKKFLLTVAVAMTAMFATAQTKTYTDALAVSINGNQGSTQQATINVNKGTDGTYTLSLNNFMLISEEDVIPVGNIVVAGVQATEENGIKSLSTTGQVVPLTEGDTELSDYWLASVLTEVPVDLSATMTDGSLFCTIDIDLTESLGQTIEVVFGKEIKATRNYTEGLTVTINGESSVAQQTTINVDEKADGTYTLSLNNFMLTSGEDVIPVGNIVIHNISATAEGNIYNFATKQTINIVEGDVEAPFWMGPMLGEVPVDITGKMTEHKLYCNIDIDMTSTLGQVINVKFGQEDLTGIEDVEVEEGIKAIHDLTGRRIDAITAPGIYIIDGKKVLVK